MLKITGKHPHAIIADLKKAMKTTIPRTARNMAVRHYTDSFRNQGFNGNILVPWKPRRGEKQGRKLGTGNKATSGRAILVRTGNLRRGIRGDYTSTKISIYNNLPYAEIHNDGFRGTVWVKSHTRERVIRRTVTGGYEALKNGRIKRGKRAVVEMSGGRHTVYGHSRRVNMPRRRFIGPSAVLMNEISKMIDRELKRASTM